MARNFDQIYFSILLLNAGVKTENIAKCSHCNPTPQTVNQQNPSLNRHLQYQIEIHTETASMGLVYEAQNIHHL